MTAMRKAMFRGWGLPFAGGAAIALGAYVSLRLWSPAETDASEHAANANDTARVRHPSDASRRAASTAPRRWPERQASSAFKDNDADEHEDGAPAEVPYEVKVAEAERLAASTEAQFVAKFESEPVDGQWASTWEQQITASLESSLGESAGFDRIAVECRSERCVAVASWVNYEAATNALASAANSTNGQCATFVYMPPPDDPARAYTHKLRFSSCRPAPA